MELSTIWRLESRHSFDQTRKSATNPTPLLNYAFVSWRSQPEMRVEDAYKWLYHATLGGDHAVQDDTGPRQWLEDEWKTLTEPLPNEPEVVKLTPDGSILRINLRPYKRRARDPKMLLALFVASAKSFKGDKKSFRNEWANLGALLHDHPRNHLTYREWLRLDKEAKGNGYPAIHHSSAYEKTYKPAYRVILGKLWQ